eukprot:m.87476 g.87476  ORF g.87476 m.87476 type:complete len:105 (-) comp12831_c2_seq1:593-907(-)
MGMLIHSNPPFGSRTTVVMEVTATTIMHVVILTSLLFGVVHCPKLKSWSSTLTQRVAIQSFKVIQTLRKQAMIWAVFEQVNAHSTLVLLECLFMFVLIDYMVRM